MNTTRFKFILIRTYTNTVKKNSTLNNNSPFLPTIWLIAGFKLSSVKMWIPHTIPDETFSLFNSVYDQRADENGRGVRSEDFGWADRTARPLRLLCLDVIGGHIKQYPLELFSRITLINAVYLVETLDTDLPISSVIHVPDGEYWRRRTVAAGFLSCEIDKVNQSIRSRNRILLTVVWRELKLYFRPIHSCTFFGA